jgi:hypothetical protein
MRKESTGAKRTCSHKEIICAKNPQGQKENSRRKEFIGAKLPFILWVDKTYHTSRTNKSVGDFQADNLHQNTQRLQFLQGWHCHAMGVAVVSQMAAL